MTNKKAQCGGDSALGFFNKIENDRFSDQNKKVRYEGESISDFFIFKFYVIALKPFLTKNYDFDFFNFLDTTTFSNINYLKIIQFNSFFFIRKFQEFLCAFSGK